jgi:Putative Actinobacterial Holin-X, holin superfamily III
MEQEDRISSFAPSLTGMISAVVADAKELLISELTLAKLEFQREFTKAKAAAVTVAIGVGFGFIGAISFVFMVVHLLAGAALGLLWHCRRRAFSIRRAGGDVRKNQN